MASLLHDQAEGLRRIMIEPKPRVVSVLSVTSSGEKVRTINNLAATLWGDGNSVLLVNASTQWREAIHQYGVGALPTLMDVAIQASTLENTILFSKLGYSAAKLMARKQQLHGRQDQLKTALSEVFDTLAGHYDVVLVDAELNENASLPLPVLEQNEILIQLGGQPDSIKQAYALIKRVSQQLRRYSFGILISATNDKVAQGIFRNLAEVARRYLSVQLEFIGTIPADEQVNHASQRGQAVVGAFPMAMASTAFKEVAKRLGYQQGMYPLLEANAFS